jgi:hypothetical protein
MATARPASSGRPGGRFSTGIEQHPDWPANNRVDSFAARIVREEPALHIGRFSIGIEQHPDWPANNPVGSFATGIAREEAAAPVVEVHPRAPSPGHEKCRLNSASQGRHVHVVGARAAEVQSAAFEHPAGWHWMLELEVDDAASGERSLQSGPIADWLRELRQLGMCPTVMLVADRPGLGPAA